MRVLLATGIYPPEIGGPASYSRSFARELLRRGDVVTIVTYGDEKTVRGEGWDVIVVSRYGGPILRYFRYARAVARHARSADVVYLQGAVSEGFPGTIGAFFAKKPIVLRVPGDYAWEMYQQETVNSEQWTVDRLERPELLDEFLTHRHSGVTRILEILERWTARQAARVIVPSRYLKSVVERWGVPAEKIAVIWSTPEPLPETPPREALRDRFSVASSYVVLTAVRAVPWKGVDFLVEVFRDLPHDTMLVVAGDGPCLEEWKARASSLGSRARFLGRISRERLAEWYLAADLFVLATGYEGFPHVVAEAASAGLPCLVSDKAGNPETKELCPEHVTVLPYRDATAWKNAILARPSRRAPVSLRRFPEIVSETRRILEKVCAS